MAVPKITIDESLCGPYPEYFLADSAQIGEFMAEFGGISDDRITDTTLNFERGRSSFKTVYAVSPNEFTLSLRGINRAHKQGAFDDVPEAWQNTFPGDDILGPTHLTLATTILGIGAREQAGDAMLDKKQFARRAVAHSVPLGGIALVSSGMQPSFGLLGIGFGIYVGYKNQQNVQKIAYQKEANARITELLTNPDLPQALKGAVRFDFRG